MIQARVVLAVGLDGAPQQFARADDVLLADELVQRARAHAQGQRGLGLGPFGLGLVEEIGGHMGDDSRLMNLDIPQVGEDTTPWYADGNRGDVMYYVVMFGDNEISVLRAELTQLTMDLHELTSKAR